MKYLNMSFLYDIAEIALRYLLIERANLLH